MAGEPRAAHLVTLRASGKEARLDEEAAHRGVYANRLRWMTPAPIDDHYGLKLAGTWDGT